MKVFVYTKAKPFYPEVYIGVKGTRKLAEKALREQFPHMKLVDAIFGSYVSDASNEYMLFIHEEEV